jgi:serine/threonine protein kinase
MSQLLTEEEINEIQKIPLTKIKGSGAFGQVFEIIYKGKKYAIKKINPEMETEEQFLREVAIHKELSSNPLTKQYVPIFYGSYENDGYYFIVMEYLEGFDLYEVCRYYGKLPKDLIHSILSQIKVILEAFHSLEIVFLDLYKHNIFIEIDENRITGVKLIDFGMSKKVGDPGYEVNEIVKESMNWNNYERLTESLNKYCKEENTDKKGGYTKKQRRTRKLKSKRRKTRRLHRYGKK